MTEEYEHLASEFDSVMIRDYDPSIWSPSEIVERDKEAHEIREPENEEVIQYILDEVEEAKQEAENSETVFFNGPLVRLQGYEVNNDTLEVDLQNTNYFSHSATRAPELDKQNRADPLSVGVRLFTSDDYLVLGEKSSMNELGAGEYQIPAGFIEDPETQYGRSLNAEPTSPIHREIEEELNLDYTQITPPQPSDLIGAASKQPMIIYDAQTPLTTEEVASEWQEIPEDDKELNELMFIGGQQIEDTLENLFDQENGEGHQLRPHALGALETL